MGSKLIASRLPATPPRKTPTRVTATTRKQATVGMNEMSGSPIARTRGRSAPRARCEVLRDVNCPAILIEGGFLTNQTEEQQVMNPEYRNRLAEAIARGILAYRRSLETLSRRTD